MSISEGGPLLSPPMPVAYGLARVQAKADTEIRAGESEVGATLSVRFLLQ